MRLEQLTVANIGGLADGTIELGAHRIIALAGPNGSGKSRLLLCLISPWLRQLPSPANTDVASSAVVVMSLDQNERQHLDAYADEMGWTNEVPMPSAISITVRHQPYGQMQFTCEPPSNALENGLKRPEFLAQVPSLDVFYLPPERRFTSKGADAVDLSALLPESQLADTRKTRADAFQNAGRLDDTEFETYAKALCVAERLPVEDPAAPLSSLEWSDFKSSIDRLLAPKELLGLTREHPAALRIRVPDGSVHALDDLSSGERQALTIVS